VVTLLKQLIIHKMNTERETILIVDDEADIREFLKYNLEKSNYTVITAKNGKEGIEVLNKTRPDLILLDVMMPGMDGMEVCALIREKEDIKQPIIAFLTARAEDYSQIAGFEVGGDDYITKPIRPRVLISRIEALLRRKSNEFKKKGEEVDLYLDRDRFTLVFHEEEIQLPKKEFELLELLLSKPGKVFTRDEIMSNVWGNETIVGERTIDVHIRKLREKIGDKYIRTIKGVGYTFKD
jgi:two-component system alkaline phosphatase synthesis response regulator PhoP